MQAHPRQVRSCQSGDIFRRLAPSNPAGEASLGARSERRIPLVDVARQGATAERGFDSRRLHLDPDLRWVARWRARAWRCGRRSGPAQQPWGQARWGLGFSPVAALVELLAVIEMRFE